MERCVLGIRDWLFGFDYYPSKAIYFLTWVKIQAGAYFAHVSYILFPMIVCFNEIGF